MPTLVYFSIASAPYLPGTHWLMVDTDPVDTWVEELQDLEADGRQSGSRSLVARAALEGAEDDYGTDEIKRSVEQSKPLPYLDCGGGAILVSEPFLCELEAEHARFRAFHVVIEHPASGRSWPDHWVVWFPEQRPLRLLRNDDVPVLRPGRNDSLMSPLYAPRVEQRLGRLGVPGLSFKRHEWPACESVPLGDGPAASAALRQAACAAFLAKTPLPSPGGRFGCEWLMEVLAEDRLIAAFAGGEEGDLVVEAKAGGGIEAVSVRENSVTARQLDLRRSRGRKK